MENNEQKGSSTKGSKKKRWVKLINGEGLVDLFLQYKIFFLFAVALLIYRMHNGYEGEKVLIEINNLRKENKRLKFESLIIESELMKLSRPSIVRKKIGDSGLDLKEPREAPGVIYVEKEE